MHVVFAADSVDHALHCKFVGEAAVLEYHQPAGFGQPHRPFAAALRSVLLGMQPLPSLGGSQPSQPAQRRLRAVPVQRLGAGGGRALQADGSGGSGGDGEPSAGDSSVGLAALNVSEVAAGLQQAVDNRSNRSEACSVNAACEPDWALQARAVVLVLVYDEQGAVYCTGGWGARLTV